MRGRTRKAVEVRKRDYTAWQGSVASNIGESSFSELYSSQFVFVWTLTRPHGVPPAAHGRPDRLATGNLPGNGPFDNSDVFPGALSSLGISRDQEIKIDQARGTLGALEDG